MQRQNFLSPVLYTSNLNGITHFFTLTEMEYSWNQSDNWAVTNLGTCVRPLEFFDLVHENKDCASQNAFALLYMIPQPPDPYRKRKPRTSGRRERIHVQYTVKKADNSRVLVCARSFISITGIGKTTKLFPVDL